jgi:hypothetical protein
MGRPRTWPEGPLGKSSGCSAGLRSRARPRFAEPARRRRPRARIRTAAPALAGGGARASTRSRAGPPHGRAGLCSPRQPGSGRRGRFRSAGTALAAPGNAASIMGRLADTVLRFGTGTRTQHHAPETGLQRRQRKAPRRLFPAGQVHVDQRPAEMHQGPPCQEPPRVAGEGV